MIIPDLPMHCNPLLFGFVCSLPNNSEKARKISSSPKRLPGQHFTLVFYLVLYTCNRRHPRLSWQALENTYSPSTKCAGRGNFPGGLYRPRTRFCRGHLRRKRIPCLFTRDSIQRTAHWKIKMNMIYSGSETIICKTRNIRGLSELFPGIRPTKNRLFLLMATESSLIPAPCTARTGMEAFALSM